MKTRSCKAAIAALLLCAVFGAARAQELYGSPAAAGAEVLIPSLPDEERVDAEAPYLAENDAAMTKMMNDMTVKPTGDVDRDVVAMMVPHHQGASDMALAVVPHVLNA